MSFYRVSRVFSINKCRFPIQNRFASTKSGKSMSLAGRLSLIGGAMVTVGAGTVIAYANHNPNFKQAVDDYIPGFKPFVNTSGEVFKHGMDVVKAGWNMIKPIITPDRGNTGIQSPTKQDGVASNNDSSTNEQLSGGAVDDEKNNNTEKSDDVVVIVTADKKDSDVIKEENEVRFEEQGERQEEQSEQVNVNVSTQEPSIVEEIIQEPVTAPVTSKEPETVQEPVTLQEPVTVQEPVSVQEPPVEPIKEDDSILEAKRITIEKELRSLYHDFINESNNVIKSIENVTESMKAHFSKIKESTETPPDNVTEIEKVSECISDTKKTMDDACKAADDCKTTHEEVSKNLSGVVAEALNMGILEELVEQVCDQALEYQRQFDTANNSVTQTQDEHKSWQDGLQQQLKEEDKDTTTVTDQLPLPDLDTQQETLLLMLRKKIDNMEEEQKRQTMEALKEQQERLQKEFDSTVENERRLFEEQLIKKEQEIDTFYEEKLKNQLYNQADAYSTHLTEALQTQASELRSEYQSDFSKKLSDKDYEYKSSLTAAMARLKGIQSMINTVSEAGKSTRKQQNIRTASDTLTSIIMTANNDSDPYTKHTIHNEVTSLKESASNDEFIQSVLSSLPKQAMEEGISSETGLIKRFDRVKRICRRVALVGEGAGMGTYLLSFIQSLVTFDMIYDKIVPEDHLASMSTLKLLSCASRHIEKGDLETAVRLVNQLSGEARLVAMDWVKEACLYLETRQAVMVISEYLAASSYTIVQ